MRVHRAGRSRCVAGLFDNPYAGLVVFVAIPACFVLGLLLIPLGMWLQRRRLRAIRRRRRLAGHRLPARRRPPRPSLAIIALTAVNIVIVLLAGYGALHWMESPSFCGQVCHTPMQPQFTAWQAAPHSGVACVQCHIGEGAGGVRARQARRRPAARARRQPIPIRGRSRPAPRCLPARRPDLRRLSPPGARSAIASASFASTPTTRANTDDDRAADASRRRRRRRRARFTGTPIPRPRRVRRRPMRRSETIPYVRVTDAQGQVKEYRHAGYDR